MELLSAVIYLDLVRGEKIPSNSGPLMQGWFFKILGDRDRSLSEDVHKKGGYTLSGVMQDSNGSYIRITSLRSDLTSHLLTTLLPALKEKYIALDTTTFRTKNILISSHNFAGQTSYGELSKQARQDRNLVVEFASPTAFRSNGMDFPLPVPYHVLLTWRNTWNAFAPEEQRIGYPIHLFAEHCIAVRELRHLSTEDVYLPKGNSTVGFKGKVGFSLQPARKCEEWSALWDKAKSDWQKLAAFALYAGSGQHTGCGMGQTHPCQGCETK